MTADFDSLLAKIIITAPSWNEVVRKARRALEDTRIDGVKTNIEVLYGIVTSTDFKDGACDTAWLEKNVASLQESGEFQLRSRSATGTQPSMSNHLESKALATSSSVLLRKGDAWSIKLVGNQGSKPTEQHHLQIQRVLRNDFPSLLAAEVTYTNPSGASRLRLEIASTSASSSAASSKLERGNPSDLKQVVIPFSGKLVEVLVDEGDVIKKGQVVCVVQQMKMELEVRASKGGRVKWVFEAEDGEDVDEGTLAAILESEGDAKL